MRKKKFCCALGGWIFGNIAPTIGRAMLHGIAAGEWPELVGCVALAFVSAGLVIYGFEVKP